MTLVDPTLHVSVEYCTLENVAELLADCHGFHCLNDGDSDTASDKVVIEQEEDPWDMEHGTISKSQLEEILLRAFVNGSEESPHNAFASNASSSNPNEGGTIEIRVMRQIRDVEYDDRGRSGVYRWFRKCIGSIVLQLPTLADAAGVVVTDVRDIGRAKWNSDQSVSEQGRSIWQNIEVDWGDRGAGGGES